MAKKITIMPQKVPLEQKKKVAAYARVSSGKDAMLQSLSAQISYYSNMIQSRNDWLYAGVYADEAKTGTKENRPEFQRMLTDCKDGKINMIITKSISRFARNTVTLLETVRELKDIGVAVFFEEQNINTLNADGELMLTILASYAQEESLSVSENQKWRVKRNFEEGKPWNGTILGYRIKNGQYVIHEKEAEIVRNIFDLYLSGLGFEAITRKLNEDDMMTRYNKKWSKLGVSGILGNQTYTGNLLLQQTFSENHITKRTIPNNGELPKYYAEGSHEAIIDMETFKAVQFERERRKKHFNMQCQPRNTYPFTGLITCENCGKSYRRKTTATGIVWICSTYNTKGKSACSSKQVPEITLEETVATVTEISFIKKIIVSNGNLLTFILKDGTEVIKEWKDRSRSESWTEEMKNAARQKSLERRDDNG